MSPEPSKTPIHDRLQTNKRKKKPLSSRLDSDATTSSLREKYTTTQTGIIERKKSIFGKISDLLS